MGISDIIGVPKERLGAKVDDSDTLDHAVRVGLVSYGIVHLLVAWLAIQLALGDRSGSASNTGAMHQLAQSGLGRWSLYVVAAGFAALVVWQAWEAAFGRRDEEGAKRTWKRIVSAIKVVVYGAVGYSALDIATGSSGKGQSTDTWTARVMSMPGGVWLVGLAGVVLVAIGVNLVRRGWTEKFLSKLDHQGRNGDTGTAYTWFGKAGYTAKGLSFGIIGLLFLSAAWTHDPDKSGGLDQALSKLLQQPFGSPLLIATAVGIGCYGLFCFAWARHLDR